MSEYKLSNNKAFPIFWENKYGVEFDIIQDENCAAIMIIVRNYGEEEETIAFSIDDDKDLQRGADLLCGEGYAKRYTEGV
jgi:hypothetical protein